MEEQLIRYVHDGSETPTDSFVLVANASEMDRQSQPMAFTITILPVNDQPPVLSTNTGLQVSSPPGPPLLGGCCPPQFHPLEEFAATYQVTGQRDVIGH